MVEFGGVTDTLSRAQARRIALAAQGFLDPRHTTPTMRTFGRTLERTGVLQVDSVNVLQRAHYMPLFSRMGPYDTALLTRAAEKKPRRLVEYWAHVQALMPVELWPVMQHRMASYRAQKGKWWQEVDDDLAEQLLAEVAARGPSTARDLDDGAPRDKKHWGWNWSEAKKALDFLYMAGELAVAGRNSQFEVIYDVPERVIPPEVLALATPSPEDADRELVRRAAASHGVATVKCLADYYRMKTDVVTPAVDALVEEGELLPVADRGVEPSGVPPPRRAPAAQGGGASLPEPLRPGRVAAGAQREAVRLPLPHRDLHARAQAGARLLRAAVPSPRRDRRPGSTSRPTARTAGWS